MHSISKSSISSLEVFNWIIYPKWHKVAHVWIFANEYLDRKLLKYYNVHNIHLKRNIHLRFYYCSERKNIQFVLLIE